MCVLCVRTSTRPPKRTHGVLSFRASRTPGPARRKRPPQLPQSTRGWWVADPDQAFGLCLPRGAASLTVRLPPVHLDGWTCGRCAFATEVSGGFSCVGLPTAEHLFVVLVWLPLFDDRGSNMDKRQPSSNEIARAWAEEPALIERAWAGKLVHDPDGTVFQVPSNAAFEHNDLLIEKLLSVDPSCGSKTSVREATCSFLRMRVVEHTGSHLRSGNEQKCKLCCPLPSQHEMDTHQRHKQVVQTKTTLIPRNESRTHARLEAVAALDEGGPRPWAGRGSGAGEAFEPAVASCSARTSFSEQDR